MKTYTDISQFLGCKNAVVTTGTFDGVHVGHQKILTRVKEIAKKTDGETVLITFHPHPRMVLQPDGDLKLINTIEERSKLLEQQGIDHLIIHPFSKEFSRLTSVEFIRDILVNQIGTKTLVIGYNHHFGRNREGSFEHLMECGPLYGFDVEEIPALDVDDINVSSTKIRNAINEGDIALATEYLGHPFNITGTVIAGNKIGRQIGFPTANLQLDDYKIIPSEGVYAVDVILDGKKMKGMLNIGIRPTLHENDKLTVEVNIFDFDQEIYGKQVELSFLKKIRNEKKFENVEYLKKQLEQDKLIALNS